jgi:preprotein translocase subunit SecF
VVLEASVTDDDRTYDDIMGDIAIRAAANGGPSTADVLRAMRASHRDLMDAVSSNRAHTEEAIRSCRESREEATAAAVKLARVQAERDKDRRAISHWLSDRVKRWVVYAVALALVAVTILLVLERDTAAAQVTGMLALMTPFLLLIYRRG